MDPVHYVFPSKSTSVSIAGQDELKDMVWRGLASRSGPGQYCCPGRYMLDLASGVVILASGMEPESGLDRAEKGGQTELLSDTEQVLTWSQELQK